MEQLAHPLAWEGLLKRDCPIVERSPAGLQGELARIAYLGIQRYSEVRPAKRREQLQLLGMYAWQSMHLPEPDVVIAHARKKLISSKDDSPTKDMKNKLIKHPNRLEIFSLVAAKRILPLLPGDIVKKHVPFQAWFTSTTLIWTAVIKLVAALPGVGCSWNDGGPRALLGPCLPAECALHHQGTRMKNPILCLHLQL